MKTLTRAEQHAQCMREVKATLLVVAVCAAWHIGTAFALNGNGRFLLGMPMWFTISVVGTCILGVAGVMLLAKFVFVDFEYDEEVDDDLVQDACRPDGIAEAFEAESSAVEAPAAKTSSAPASSTASRSAKAGE